ncbi:MAG: insulinase family protein [Bdellovibrionales bacterium]|nr:insulinase family protein [Bdellovibrionales bacterium]
MINISRTIYKVFKSIMFVALALNIVSCAGMGSSGSVKIPPYRDVTLNNGLKVLIIEDHSLPYISAGLLIRTGSSHDPLGKSGLAEMTALVLDRGTKNYSATELADKFGQLGTSFSADADYDYTYLSASGLSDNQDELLKLFFEVATRPAFSVSEVNRAKSEMIAEVKRGYDQPGYVAGRLYSQLLFGSHPYGRSPSGTVRDLQSIKQKDLIKGYLKNFRPNNAQLVLVGDLKPDIVKTLNETLAEWKPRENESDKLPSLMPINGVQVQLVNRPDLKQSEVRIGHYGVKRKNKDYQALLLAETILGDGFTSRLMSEIRVKRGLTYGIRSSFDAREEVGPFTISSNTRHEKVGELVTETLNVLKEFYDKGVTEQEVENAKGYLRGAFPRNIETPDQMARMLLALRFYGIEDDYMTDYIRNLNAISVSDVNKVIRKYYNPANLKVLIYAPKNKVIDQVRPIGAVEVKEYRELL